jgi:GMP synthase-like glutamine amidotransferase
MRYHTLQHVSFETPGLLVDEVLSRGHSLRNTALYAGEQLPSTGEFDVLIIMGGPMSIHDEVEYPWLIPEKELIGAAIREGKKLLGICLGAQLIAAVCGARVYPNLQKEIGFWPVTWGDREETVFHWHGETFDLPAGAIRLASTDACVNQAFSLGDKVLGIQFHPEVTGEIIRGMVGHEGWELVEGPYIQPEREIMKGVKRWEERSRSGHNSSISFITSWLWPIQA